MLDPADATAGEQALPDVPESVIARPTFPGMGFVGVIVSFGAVEWRRTTGDHVLRYDDRPTNEADRRRVTVPLHDERRSKRHDERRSARVG